MIVTKQNITIIPTRSATQTEVLFEFMLALVVIALILFLSACLMAASFPPCLTAKSEKNQKSILLYQQHIRLLKRSPQHALDQSTLLS